jgi:hypothetical protein
MMNLKEKYLQLQMREYASITIMEEQLNPSRRCKGGMYSMEKGKQL